MTRAPGHERSRAGRLRCFRNPDRLSDQVHAVSSQRAVRNSDRLGSQTSSFPKSGRPVNSRPPHPLPRQPRNRANWRSVHPSVCLDRSRREPPQFSREAVPAIPALWLSHGRGEPISLERLYLDRGLSYKGWKSRNLKSQDLSARPRRCGLRRRRGECVEWCRASQPIAGYAAEGSLQ